MIRRYETMFVVKATLTEDECKAQVEAIKEVLIKQGADIKAEDNLGTRDLAYKIEKNARGYYALFYFTAEPSALAELERVYGISEDILRFVVIKYEKQVEVAAWENMVKKANGLPVAEKKLSYAPKRERAPRRFDNRDRKPRYEGNRDNRNTETKTEKTEG
jgi:small subunit ribosomal protein S6